MRGKPLVGVWVDHRQAVLFWADEHANMQVQEVNSGYQEEGEPTDGVEAAGEDSHGGAVPHANLAARRREQLKHYYKKLAQTLRPAGEIFLFGPGQAKKELASYIGDDKGAGPSRRTVEAADKKMTRPQMAARVREFFDLPRQRV